MYTRPHQIELTPTPATYITNKNCHEIIDIEEATNILVKIHSAPVFCWNCGTTSTPVWRNVGHFLNGRKKIVCNACGLRHKRKKESQQFAE